MRPGARSSRTSSNGLSVLLDAYGEARAHGSGSDRLDEIAAAVAQNPVGTLLVVAERQIPGSVAADAGTGGK